MNKDTEIVEGKHQRPSFLVVIPTFGMVPIEFVVAFARLQMPINCEAKSLIITKTEIGVARTFAAETLLKMSPLPKYLMFIGDDMLPAYDGLIKLWQEMETDRWDILAGLYYLKQDIPVPIIWRDNVTGWLEPYKHFQPGEVVDVDVCGMDFTLIKSDALKKLEPPWFQTGPGELPGQKSNGDPDLFELSIYTEDVYFCKKARNSGLKIGVHTDVRVGHILTRTGEVY